jgi:hypothetical protein
MWQNLLHTIWPPNFREEVNLAKVKVKDPHPGGGGAETGNSGIGGLFDSGFIKRLWQCCFIVFLLELCRSIISFFLTLHTEISKFHQCPFSLSI